MCTSGFSVKETTTNFSIKKGAVMYESVYLYYLAFKKSTSSSYTID